MRKKGEKKQSTGSNKGSLKWFFPSTDHGENSGFADSLLEYFQGDHEKFIARETIQNAVDACKDPDRPVSVIFEHFTIPVASLPDHQQLSDRLNQCLAFVKGQKKAEEFFKSAVALLKSGKLSVLKISDFNTKGLSGDDDDVDGNWYRLVRASGTSSPKGVAGGSFGIGKGAPFAASDLRTVFYSSMNENGHAVLQGKARLVSHHDKDRDVRQGVGFYGLNGYQAIREPSAIPDLFKRTEVGTDIFIIGYKEREGWEDNLIKSVLHNFWLTIHRGNLEVTVKGAKEKVITSETLPACLEEFEAEKAKFYYEAVTNFDGEFHRELKHLGMVDLYVKKGEGFPKKVMTARKPKMLVEERDYRVLREPFAGVLLCENDQGNTLLRELEPPEHDEWNKDRAKNGWAALQELEIFIKESLKSMGEAVTSAPEDIPGLDRYLPESEERENMPQSGAVPHEPTDKSGQEESGREVGTEKQGTAAPVETVVRKGIVTSKQIGTVRPTVPEGPGEGPRGRATGNEGGEKEGVRIKTSNISFRSFVQNDKSGPIYNFVITGREDCEGAIRLVAVGDDGNYPVQLQSAKDARSGKEYEVKDSLISGLAVESGKPLRLAVTLPSKKKYALGIENYEG